jgi:putative addiction module component (TIGR02574 family)
MTNLTQIEEAIRQLTPADVDALREWILEYEPEQAEKGGQFLTDAQRAELRRRVAEDDADPDAAVPWDEVYEASLRRARQ